MASQETDTGEEYLAKLLGEKGQEPVDKDVDKVEIKLPPWFDEELFKRGQKNYFKYLTSMTAAMLGGVLSVLAIPTILKVLICSRKSGTALDAYRRYLRTIYHIVAWHEFEMKPGTNAWQSITMVRKTHLAARKMCEHTEQITITQKDMALTQFGFLGLMILKPHMLGIPDIPEVMAPLVHVWRVLGYLVGIKDEFNLCSESVTDSRKRINLVLDRIYRPALEKADTDFDHMSKALLDGLWHSDIILFYRPYMHFTKRLCGCQGYEYFESDFKEKPTKEDLSELKYLELKWWERAVLFYLIVKFQYLYAIPILRVLYNMSTIVAVMLNFYLPLIPMYKFGIKMAYVRIFRGKTTEPSNHYD